MKEEVGKGRWTGRLAAPLLQPVERMPGEHQVLAAQAAQDSRLLCSPGIIAPPGMTLLLAPGLANRAGCCKSAGRSRAGRLGCPAAQ